MKAMVLNRLGAIAEGVAALDLEHWPLPQPGAGEVRLRVLACGVCHTELDIIEGRAPPPRLPLVPGHEVVGVVDAVGTDVQRWHGGERVGVGWIYASNGQPDENLAAGFVATGRDRHGGYAEYMVAHADYIYPIPVRFSAAEAAPLLCAGAIGYRALALCGLVDGGTLGLTGFGGSAHLVMQLARHRYPHSPVMVFARDAEVRAFAARQGADWVGDTQATAAQPCDAIIDTTPAWAPVVEALKNLKPGGRLVINAIRKESRDQDYLQRLSYHEHLWMEREIKSVANITARDIDEFLRIAAAIPIHAAIETYALEDANRALLELRRGRIRGAKVLLIGAA